MAANWMRRTVLSSVAAASVALLAACGSSSVANSVKPDSLVTFGDALSDLGQNPNGRPYSVTTTTTAINNWTLEVANQYDLTLAPAKQGGTAYAQGNARVALPDATGVTNAPSITAQIDSFLAANPSFGSKQFVLMSGGMSDIIAGYNEYAAGTKSKDAYMADMVTAGTLMGEQVIRLNKVGAPRILVVGSQNLGRTLWAKDLDDAQQGGDTKPSKLLEDATTAFNNALLLKVNAMDGREVLYADVQYYFNRLTGDPSNYSFTNAKETLCNSVDASNSMNIGPNQVNSSLCTDATLVNNEKIRQYLFADKISYTPEAHRQLGTWIQDRMEANW